MCDMRSAFLGAVWFVSTVVQKTTNDDADDDDDDGNYNRHTDYCII
jgi:hypothetical protein